MTTPDTDAGKALISARVCPECETDDYDKEITPLVIAIEVEAAKRERERIANDLIFDLPIGNDVNYSRGYSAAIREMRRVLREEPA